jgi:hypothetical protein
MDDSIKPQVPTSLDYGIPKKSGFRAGTTFWTMLGFGLIGFGTVFGMQSRLWFVEFHLDEDLGQEIGFLGVFVGGICYIISRSLADRHIPLFLRILTALAGLFYLWAILANFETLFVWPLSRWPSWYWHWRQDAYQYAFLMIGSAIASCFIARFFAFFYRKKQSTTQVQ